MEKRVVGCVILLITLVCVYQLTPISYLHLQRPFTSNQSSSELTTVNRYEEGIGNCSISVLRNESEMLARQTKPLAKCTFKYFNSYLSASRRFYGEGVWFIPTEHTASKRLEFHPQGCHFEKVSKMSIGECFRRRNISKILIMGDSNARMLTMNMLVLLEKRTGANCWKMSAEESTKSARYFVVPNVTESLIETHPCGFGSKSCSSWKYQCTIASSRKKAHNFTVEYIVFLNIIDNTVSLPFKGSKIFSRWLMRAENKLVYLLKFYLPHHGFPDLWIISPPFHHEAWVYHLAHVEANIDYMLSLLRIYVPLSTTVVFMADARECPDKRPPQVLVEFLKA